MNLDSCQVLAYEGFGGRKVFQRASIGDEIEWKRNGTAGAFRCRVLKITGQLDLPPRYLRLRVKLLSHDGVEIPGDKERTITPRAILRVYPH